MAKIEIRGYSIYPDYPTNPETEMARKRAEKIVTRRLDEKTDIAETEREAKEKFLKGFSSLTN
ncbi:hypothetical protein KJ953_02470 [Patescibacteria group bacterium]|nr:hypothetical protein [Patescibacteria group bacterium]MBU1256683.1 hypothetical protein [Patescibacteria group bacterium]MBU1457159.1 hypothetical protein [Patescibacteria group bacterium]